MKGGKGFTMTGHVGQVMQESMQAALAWVRSNAADYDIDPEFFQSKDIHIHVPSGAIPKTGLRRELPWFPPLSPPSRGGLRGSGSP